MSKGKYASKRSRSSKSLVLVLALVMLITATVGGTLAWLGDKTETVTNTFSASGIDIKLEEHVYDPNEHKLTATPVTTNNQNDDYVMVPGWTIPKDPKTWVVEGSEPAFLFVEVVESENFDDFMTYAIADGWTALTDVDGVYYREVEKNQMGEANKFSILKNDQVVVLDTITNADMENVEEEPVITFTAYAVQLYKSYKEKFAPADAWNLAKDMAVTTP